MVSPVRRRRSSGRLPDQHDDRSRKIGSTREARTRSFVWLGLLWFVVALLFGALRVLGHYNSRASAAKQTRATPNAHGTRASFLWSHGRFGEGHDLEQGHYTVVEAQARCNTLPLCYGFSYYGGKHAPEGSMNIRFKTANVGWEPAEGWSTMVKGTPAARRNHAGDVPAFKRH